MCVFQNATLTINVAILHDEYIQYTLYDFIRWWYCNWKISTASAGWCIWTTACTRRFRKRMWNV